MDRMIQIAQPYFDDEELQLVQEPILSKWVTQGKFVKEFENIFAKKHKVKYAVAVSNCTTALHLSLLALGVGPGDEVIVPSFSWIATANAVLYCGGTPVLVDIDLDTFNIDPKKIASKINKKTRAIIAVHLFGLCADIDAIKKVAPGIPIIEDGACAAGSKYKGKFAGSLGKAGCFSFHPRKTITTGEGGMVTTNSKKIARMVNILRNHGAVLAEEVRHSSRKPYLLSDFNELGYNYRMTDLQGALGVAQIKKLDKLIAERKKWARFYMKQLIAIPWLKTPQELGGFDHSWQAFVCLIGEKTSPLTRDEFAQYLWDKGISTRPGTHAIHTIGFYKKKYGFKNKDFPNSFNAHKNSIALPLHNNMSKADFNYIIEAIKLAGNFRKSI